MTLDVGHAPALVEIGAMRNATDARLLAAPSLRAREAAALTAGIRACLGR